MSGHPDEKPSPATSSNITSRQRSSLTSNVSLFILLIVCLFLVTGLAIVAVTYNLHSDSVLRIIGMALGFMPIAASISLPVFAVQEFSGIRKRQLGAKRERSPSALPIMVAGSHLMTRVIFWSRSSQPGKLAKAPDWI